MFALEITFRDGVSNSEMVLVRRPQAVVGASDFAHVVVEDMKQLGLELRLLKGIGTTFRSQPITNEQSKGMQGLLEGVYSGEASFDLGAVNLHVTSLDSDLAMKEGEPPDRAGVRVLRQASVFESPKFPALMVVGPYPMILSFAPEQPIYVGRSKRCALRLDSADISAEHARVGFESGEFWVEDLGSTNGTYVNGQQISGRQKVASGVPIILGREANLVGITSESQIQSVAKNTQGVPLVVPESTYPVILAVSELVRPARMPLRPGSSINLGRDPMSDIWIGSPHVSRRHGTIGMSKTGALTVVDHSTNGLAMNGVVLARESSIDIPKKPSVFDFGGGVHIAICFNAEDEQTFITANGAVSAFGSSVINRVNAVDVAKKPKAGITEPEPATAESQPVVARRRSIGRIFSAFRSLSASRRILFILGLICIVLLVVIVFNVVGSKLI